MEKAISINKSFSDAYYLISAIFRKQKKYKKSIKYLRKVLDTNGEDYIAYYDIYKLYKSKYKMSKIFLIKIVKLKLSLFIINSYNNFIFL